MADFKSKPGPTLSFDKLKSNDNSQRKSTSEGFAYSFAVPKLNTLSFEVSKEGNTPLSDVPSDVTLNEAPKSQGFFLNIPTSNNNQTAPVKPIFLNNPVVEKNTVNKESIVETSAKVPTPPIQQKSPTTPIFKVPELPASLQAKSSNTPSLNFPKFGLKVTEKPKETQSVEERSSFETPKESKMEVFVNPEPPIRNIPTLPPKPPLRQINIEQTPQRTVPVEPPTSKKEDSIFDSIPWDEIAKNEESTAKSSNIFSTETPKAFEKLQTMCSSLQQYKERLEEMAIRLYMLNNDILFMNTPLIVEKINSVNQDLRSITEMEE